MRSRVTSAVGALVLGLAVVRGAAAQAPEPAPSAEVAGNEADEAAQKAAFEATLHPASGDVALKGDLAHMNLPESYRYLNPADTDRVLQAWGNPPEPDTLGMIYPAASHLFEKESWGVIVTYSDDGHVDDDDAKSIDYADLLADMQKDTSDANEERRKAGYDPIQLVGWAEPPHYDPLTKKLYWAKELAFGTAPDHTLNYAVRILGREGVLQLNAVAPMGQIASIRRDMASVIAFTDFKDGNRYADFKPNVDKLAAYGIGALIAGKVAAKAGFFKILIAALIAGKKFVALAVIGAGAALKSLWSRKTAGGSPPPNPEPPTAG